MADNLDNLFDLQDPHVSEDRKAAIYKEQRDFLNKQLKSVRHQADEYLAIIVWLMQNGHHEITTAARVAVRLERSK